MTEKNETPAPPRKPDGIITTHRNGQTIVAELFFNHSGTETFRDKLLKRLRRTLNLTQQQFADRLNVGRNNIAGYETGKRSPSDAAIALICREFSVSTQWLREGIGEMFIEQTQDEQIVSFIGNIQRSEADSFKKQLLSVLANLTEEQWKVLAEIAGKLPQAKQGNGYGL